MNTLWHGRFDAAPSDELLAFTVSLPFDRRLASDDIAGSRAHVSGLVRAHILTPREADAIGTALDQIEDELQAGTFTFLASDEDIHTAIERRTTELAGPAGAKLHTGRSRNDQVATDLRLYTRRALTSIALRLHELRGALAELATDAGDAYLPGYTHLQQAQPVLLAHHLLAHGWALGRDVDRLLATRQRADVCPLGAGALAGSSLPLDPEFTAEVLGFASAFENSLDAVCDRDFVAETLFDLALVGVHLSRIGEEVVLWSTEEFGFLRLHDAYSTGSSMLPAEEEPRHRRAGPGQDGPADRQPHRAAGHAEGPAARVQPRPAGGQGAAVRLRRPGAARGRRAARSADELGLRPAAHAEGGRRPRTARPPTSPSTWCPTGCRSGTRTWSSAGWCATRSSDGCRWPISSRRTPTSARRRPRCSSRVSRSPGARPAAVPVRWPWRRSWPATKRTS